MYRAYWLVRKLLNPHERRGRHSGLLKHVGGRDINIEEARIISSLLSSLFNAVMAGAKSSVL